MTLCNICGKNPLENYFRKTFDLSASFDRAVLRIFADTGFELFINGQLVSMIDEWANTRDYDVTSFVREKCNLIAVRAFNHSGHRGFALELAVNGRSIVVTDGTWQTFPSERWDWIRLEYDDRDWDLAQVMDMSAAGGPQWSTLPGNDPAKIIPALEGSPFLQREIPKCTNSVFFDAKNPGWQPSAAAVNVAGEAYLKYTQQVLPQVQTAQRILELNDGQLTEGAITLAAPGRYQGPNFILDFGSETVGWLRLKIESVKEVSIRLNYGETLDEALTEPSRDQLLHKMLVEEYRLRGGVQEFESRTKVGGRFVRVEFFDAASPVTVSGFSLKTSFYPVNFKGYFNCNDPLLNQIWQAGAKTLHLCMQEYYLDGIKRDRFLWIGDARNEAWYNYYLFGDRKLFQFCWRQLAKCQYPDGAIPSAYGQGLSVIWDYVAWYVIALDDYYLHTGDAAFVLELRPTLDKAVEFLIAKASPDSLIEVPPNPLNVWMVTLNNTPGIDTLMNQLYLRSLNAAVMAAKLADDPAKLAYYETLAAKMTPQVAALTQAQPLTACPANHHNATSMLEIVIALFAADPVAALQKIRQSWGKLLAGGADTLFEGFYCKGSYPPVAVKDKPGKATFVSYCHGWTAGPTLLLMSEVAGVKPLTPGFAEVEIAPKPGDLTHFCCVVPTLHGEIALSYQPDAFCLSLPANVTAQVRLPGRAAQTVTGPAELTL